MQSYNGTAHRSEPECRHVDCCSWHRNINILILEPHFPPRRRGILGDVEARQGDTERKSREYHYRLPFPWRKFCWPESDWNLDWRWLSLLDLMAHQIKPNPRETPVTRPSAAGTEVICLSRVKTMRPLPVYELMSDPFVSRWNIKSLCCIILVITATAPEDIQSLLLSLLYSI